MSDRRLNATDRDTVLTLSRTIVSALMRQGEALNQMQLLTANSWRETALKAALAVRELTE